MLAHAYNIRIDNCVQELGHCREVVDDLKITAKSFFSILMKTVQLPGEKGYDKNMAIYTHTLK